MYNWRLLLLAFVAVFQPIASFNDRNLVDGRQQCCDHRLERDTTHSLYGNSRFKLSSEHRYATDQRREIRQVRSDERRHENNALSRLALESFRDSKEREDRRSLELGTRFSRTESQRERESRAQNRLSVVSDNRARITREAQRDTRFDTIRNAPIRSHEHRDSRNVLSGSSRARQENRVSSYRITRDVFDSKSNMERRSTNSQRDTRNMNSFNIDVNHISRENRETRADLRRTRDIPVRTERQVKSDRRIETDESRERRVLESRIERNRRSVRSLERLSADSNVNRRFSTERARIVDEERNTRVQSRDNFRGENERRTVDERIRERVELDRTRTSRFTTAQQRVDNSRDRRSLIHSTRGDNEFRVSPNTGERAYEIDELRNNIRSRLTYRSERRIARERYENERYSSASLRSYNANARERIDERAMSADRRSVSQMRHNREDAREFRVERRVSVDRRGRETTTERLARSVSRLSDKRAFSFRNSLEREPNEIRRELNYERIVKQARDERERSNEIRRESTNERIVKQARDERERSREVSRDRREARITESRRSHIANIDDNQRRNDNRSLRERTLRFRERLTSEQRPARENQRRIESKRSYRVEEVESRRNTMRERQFQQKVETNRLSANVNSREIARERDVRDERREIRSIDRSREMSRDASVRYIEVQNRPKMDSARHYEAKHSQKNDNKVNDFNWQYLIYTLQGIYLCSVFLPIMMAKNDNPKKAKNFGWWPTSQNALKMD